MDDPTDSASLEACIERCRRLEAENRHLRGQLARLGLAPPIPHDAPPTPEVPNSAKPTKRELNTSQKITLVKGDLRGIVRARRLSEATMSNIRQNLFFAFVYNALGMPIAAEFCIRSLGYCSAR
jgi:anti-sigma factor RsiW